MKFAENRRPSYYGTWRKKSSIITARRPFQSDTKFFDYEIDSDDEWEEDEPGESLNGSDDEKDKESDDDYEVDNEFFVPHGYLSEEENQEEEEIHQDNRPETQKAKLKILQQEFAAEMKKKTEKIKPRLIGCIWTDINGNKDESCHQTIWDLLQTRTMICDKVIFLKKSEVNSRGTSPSGENSDNEMGDDKDKSKKPEFTEEDIINLIKLIHGNNNKKEFLVTEFLAFKKSSKDSSESSIEPFTKAKIRSKITELGTYSRCTIEGPLFNKFCWNVSLEKLQEYKIQNIETPNSWNYTLKPTRVEQKIQTPSTKTKSTSSSSSNGEKNIKNFGKISACEEIKKELNINNVDSGSGKISTTTEKTSPKSDNQKNTGITKKRVPLLMSVPRGERISQGAKNNLISQFLKHGKLLNPNKNEDKEIDDGGVIELE